MRRELRAATRLIQCLTLAAVTLTFAACARDQQDGAGGADGDLSGAVVIDGSSTVFPITEAVAEEFQIANPGARVTVGYSGTGGGFSRFCGDEIDITGASRPIADDERAACAAAGIEFMEMPVAWDGLSVMVNPANDAVQCLTMEELRRIWEPDSQVETWSDVRPGLPAEEISLYGPGTDSGTFDYFTEAVVGESGASRADYQASEDDNILVQGVAGDQGALGYFGYAYYIENQDRLKLVGVDAGSGCVLPSDETIEAGTYPLARPIFIYVKRSALDRPVVDGFVRFFMENAAELVPTTGYHAMDAGQYQQNLSGI
jgi:phosphate transport system substrate-binding protein